MNPVDPSWQGLHLEAEISVEDNYTYGRNDQFMESMGRCDPETNDTNNNHGGGPGLNPVESLDCHPAQGTGLIPDLGFAQHREDALPRVALGNNKYINQQSMETAPTEPNNLEESWWVSDINSPSLAERNDALMDFIPKEWELGTGDLQSLFTDYYFSEHDSQLELAAAQASAVAADCVFSFENDGSAFQIKSDPDSAEYWASYFGQLQAEQWEEHELQDINYAYEIGDWFENPTEETNKIEIPPEPELVMAIDQHGQMTPMDSAVMVIKDLQGRPCSKLLRVLFDSGGSTSMIHRKAIPKGTRLNQTQSRTLMNTLAGPYAPLGSATAKGMRIPAFDKNRVIDQHEFLVFDSPCNYDIILGGDFLRKVGMTLDYKDLKVEWLGNTIPMESLNSPKAVAAHVDAYLAQIELEDQSFEEDNYFSAPIKDAKYDKVDINEIIEEHCSHLDNIQKTEVRNLLSKPTK